MIAAVDMDALPYLIKRRLMKAFITFEVVTREAEPWIYDSSFALPAPQSWADVFRAEEIHTSATTSAKRNDKILPILQLGWFPTN